MKIKEGFQVDKKELEVFIGWASSQQRVWWGPRRVEVCCRLEQREGGLEPLLEGWCEDQQEMNEADARWQGVLTGG